MVPEPDCDGDGLLPVERSFERQNMPVFGMELWLSEDKRCAANLPGAAKRFQNALPGHGKRLRVGNQHSRLVAKLLPKYLWRPPQRAPAQFHATRVPGCTKRLRK